MDINAALIDLLESIAARDFEAARAALDSIESWLGKGGFLPESIHAALDALRFTD